MTSVHRSALVWPLIGAACLSSSAFAAKLKVMNDAGTAAVSEVTLQSVHYNPGTKRLHVTTATGNTDCGDEVGGAPALGALGVVVNDGATPKSYALRTSGLPADRDPVEYLLSSRDVEVVLNSSVYGTGTNGGCKSSDVTALKLRFDDRQSLSVAEQVRFNLPTKTFDIRVTEPVLCYAFNPAASGLKVSLRSPAEANAVLLPGFFKLNYEQSGKVLHAYGDSGDGMRSTQCLDLLANPFSGQGAPPTDPGRIFTARFENADVQADVRLVARATQSSANDDVTMVVGSPNFAYAIQLDNLGNGTAGGVVVREFLPATVVGGSWTCRRYADATDLTGVNCSTASGSGRLNDFPVGGLAPGERVLLTLNRSVPGGIEGQNLTLGAAAFVNPAAANSAADGNFGNNSDPVGVSVIGNASPVLQAPSYVAYEDGNAADPQAPTQASAGLSIPLTFTDSDSAALTITAVTTGGTVGLPTTITPVPTLSGSAGTFTGTLVLPATGKDRNGAVSVTLTVSDGSSSVQRSFGFDVLPRNDAPLFNLPEPAVITVPACSGTCAETTIDAFVTGAAAGPATALTEDEGSQTTAPVLTAGRISCASPPSGFFNNDENPTLFVDGANHGLRFRAGSVAGTVTCSVTLRDSGSPQGVTTKTFTIGHASPPPVITFTNGVTAGSDVQIPEDVPVPTTGEVRFTVTDDETLPVGTPTISSGAPTILGASLVATGTANEWRVTFAPVADQSGSDIVLTVDAVDSAGGSASRTFTVDVTPQNDAPRIAVLDNMSRAEDQSAVVNLWSKVSDPESDPFDVDVTGLPGGVGFIFDHGQGIFTLSGKPDFQAAASSPYTVTVTATAVGNPSLTSSRTFEFTVTNTNRPPTLANAIPDQSATVAAALNFQFDANTFADADNDTLVYAADLSNGDALPTWLSFDAGTRTFSGTPAAGDVGAPAIRVTASDGNGGSVVDSFVLTVAL